jgi:3-hydroxyisobutyrate dehydrogenase
MSTPRIAFLGLGLMGGGMARRLLGAGFSLAVYNRDLAKAETLGAAGAHLAATPREAAARAEIVFCMVADDPASRAMWLGVGGALAGAPQGATVVECSTLTVGWVKELAHAAEVCGCEFVDAPVTGSKNAAANGELNFLVGGSAAALEKIRPVLAVMGRSITHLGPTGSGALIKLINNFVCGVQLASIAEALAWIEQSGLDREQALAVLLNGAPGSPLAKLVASRMTAGDFTPHFPLKLMAKDLAYAAAERSASAHPLATAAAALAVLRKAVEAGHGTKDMSAVIEGLRSKN